MAHLSFQCELVRASGFRLSAQFECGDGVTALCGPSGSGKTTILHLIAGLLRPDAGEIRLSEQVLTSCQQGVHLPPERRNVGLVFQDGCLFPHLTVRQNLEYGWRRQCRRRIAIQPLVEMLEISDLLKRLPMTLSGGQKQRVALGRALLRSPDLLLLDEPLASLDEPLQDRVIEHLKRIIQGFGVPTLIVTHNRQHAHDLAQTVVVVAQGQVSSIGKSEVVLGGRLMP